MTAGVAPAQDDGVEQWRAWARRWEDRAKAARSVIDSLQSGDELAAERRRADAAEREAARFRVAYETGIPERMLVGDTPDELRAYAARLAEFRDSRRR